MWFASRQVADGLRVDGQWTTLIAALPGGGGGSVGNGPLAVGLDEGLAVAVASEAPGEGLGVGVNVADAAAAAVAELDKLAAVGDAVTVELAQAALARASAMRRTPPIGPPERTGGLRR